MLAFNTEMHVVTFALICIEMIALISLVIYRLVRPDHEKTWLNIILIILLVVYNVSGGLLPDTDLPGSIYLQNAIAYGIGFIVPCYFPYYVYKGFGLEKMRFHVYKGVFLCLLIPYVLFVGVYLLSLNLETAKYLLILPLFYALWVIQTLTRAVNHKYAGMGQPEARREEKAVLLASLSPWVVLPVLDYCNAGQPSEVLFTNIGFLLMLTLQIKQNILSLRSEHEKLILIESKLLRTNLQAEDIQNIFNTNCDRFLFTRREKQIAALICQGMTYKSIGEELFISEKTVSKHIQHMFEKVQVSNKIQFINKLQATG